MPWALAIAAWECRTLRQKRARRRETPEEVAAEPADASGEETLLRRDLERAVRTALGELSELDQDALIATFWEQSGSATGATLRKRRERALDRLRQAFRSLYGLD
jgi:RNA polymerase sigma-70 factor (ECF subfamily)